MSQPIVSTGWLGEHISDDNLKVVDASWYLPMHQRSGADEYKKEHIPGAIFWDIDEIADLSSGLPHTMPNAEAFKSHMEKLGLGSEHFIIIYDGMGLFSAARPWWMLKSFGHEKCAVLDGGFPKWKAENRPLSNEAVAVEPALFKPKLNSKMFWERKDIFKNIAEEKGLVIDARSARRFRGEEPEPRPNCRSGHIPDSKSLPFDKILNPEDQTLLDKKQLKAVFDQVLIDPDKPVITSCGSGVTACILALGLEITGKKNIAVYDGSWSEWGSTESMPIEIG